MDNDKPNFGALFEPFLVLRSIWHRNKASFAFSTDCLMANEMAKQGTLKKHACKTPDTHGLSNPWYFLGIFQETSHFSVFG